MEKNGNIDLVYGINKITPEKIRETSILIHNITKEEVQKKDYSGIEKLFSVLRTLKTEARGKIALQFAGYDDNPKEIYEIKEIRDYLSEMFNRWPEMFYYITQKNVIYKVLLACIVDVKILVKGDKKGVDSVLFEGESLTPVHFSLSIPENIRYTIQTKIREYGHQIGEKEEVINTIIENLLIPSKGVQDDVEENTESLRRINLLEVHTEFAEKLWKTFTNNKEEFKIVPEHKLIKFIKNNKKIIDISLVYDRLSTKIPYQGKFTNIFVINDKSNAPICPICNSSKVIIFKKNMFAVNIDDCIFLPSAENYFNEKIVPLSERFLDESPIPVNPKTDKWICPNCLEIHSFKYDNVLGLRY